MTARPVNETSSFGRLALARILAIGGDPAYHKVPKSLFQRYMVSFQGSKIGRPALLFRLTELLQNCDLPLLKNHDNYQSHNHDHECDRAQLELQSRHLTSSRTDTSWPGRLALAGVFGFAGCSGELSPKGIDFLLPRGFESVEVHSTFGAFSLQILHT